MSASSSSTASSPSTAASAATARNARIATVARRAALIGAGAMTLGTAAAAIAYTGTEGEPYSFLNHWVSELGEIGVSSLAWAFNAGLIVGGLGFAVFMAGLAITGRDRLRWAYGVIGVIAGVAGALVGVFPMNQRAIHGVVALTFFNLGWIAVTLASIPVLVGHDRRFPRWLPLAGGATVAVFLWFLYEFGADPIVLASRLGAPAERPDVWLVTALEWAVIVGIIGWTVLAALTWHRDDVAGPHEHPDEAAS